MRQSVLILVAIGALLLVPTVGIDVASQELTFPSDEWPQELSYPNGARLVIYQPQVERWENREQLYSRVAIAFSTSADEAPSLGSFEVEATTETDLDTRQVLLSNLRITDGRFPSLEGDESTRLLLELNNLLPGDTVLSLDRLLSGLGREEGMKPANIRTDPPLILVSTTPAALVLVEGEPIFQEIPGNPLRFIVNTNWDLFYDPSTIAYFLLNEDYWLTTTEFEGAWTYTRELPKALRDLPKHENWEDVRKHRKGGRKLNDQEQALVPAIYARTEPTELIVIDGDPTLSLIADSDLAWVNNSEADLFLSATDGHFYFLVSGRWFKADTLDGPWAFATPDLPADFQAIPEDHPRADVRALVPGTPEAEEAVMLAQIPQKATVDRAGLETEVEVEYAGDPEFKAIDGTAMSYGVNTANDVIKVGDLYYLCFQAVWFVSATPNGPWEVTDAVPDQIYDIPPSSPVHNTTYVTVEQATSTTVTFGYTPGYVGVYFGWGCMMFGTGWYYPPYYYYPRPYYPIYYPRPYTYGARAYYNPYTGTYGRGARVYGPYGGAGYGSAYNPRTGTYARGGAAYGPYQSRGWAEAYNPRTGTYAQTRQGSNMYSSWGSTHVQRGNDWARTARYSGPQGSVRGVRTSEGNSAFVARGNDNVYAGRDGNVYRRDGSGDWQQWGGRDDGWQGVDAPDRSGTARNRPGTADGRPSTFDGDSLSAQAREIGREAGAATGQRDRAGTAGPVNNRTFDQLNRDATSRSRGNSRVGSYGNWQRSGGTRQRSGGGMGGGGMRRGGGGRRR